MSATIQIPDPNQATDSEVAAAVAAETTRALAVEALKSPLASPTFTGTVTVPTAVNPTDAAQKTYVDAKASRFTTTTTKTASYNASAWDFVLANPVSGAFPVNLPASGLSGDTVVVRRVANASTNVVTVAPNGADTINGSATSATIKLDNEVIWFKSNGAGNWDILAGQKSLPSLDARYKVLAPLPSGDTSGATDFANLNALAISGMKIDLQYGTYWTNASLPMLNDLSWQGLGDGGATIVKLANGANCDVFQGYQFSSLTMTGTAPFAGGVHGSSLAYILVDGNSANQTSTSYGYRVFGYANRVHDVTFRNSFTSHFWHECGALASQDGPNNPGSECYFTDIKGYLSGSHGALLLGPSDCTVNNFTIGFSNQNQGASGIGFWGMADQKSNVLSTDSSMNGTNASGFTGTFNVKAASFGNATDFYAASGTLAVTTSSGTATMTYTGKTATSFTGCAVTSGSGTFATGNKVITSGVQRFTTNGLVLSEVHPFGTAQSWAFVLDGTTTATNCHSDGTLNGGVLIRGSASWHGGEVYDFTPITTSCGFQLGDNGSTPGVPLSATIASSACDIDTHAVGFNLDTSARSAVNWVNAVQSRVRVLAVTQTTGTHSAVLAAGSNGVDLSTFTSGSPGTLFVTSTNQIPITRAGTLVVPTALGNVTCTYTGTNGSNGLTSRTPGTQFLNVIATGTSGSGYTMSTGGTVSQANFGTVGVGGTPDNGSRIDVHVCSASTAASTAASIHKAFGPHRFDLGSASNAFQMKNNGLDAFNLNTVNNQLQLPNGLEVQMYLDNYSTKIWDISSTNSLITGPVRNGKNVLFPGQNHLPTDQELITWTFDPVQATANSVVPTAGTVYICRVHCPAVFTATNVILYTITAGGTLTSGQCFAGLYTGAGVLVASTADVSSGANSFAMSGSYTFALAGGPYASQPAGDYYVAFMFNGTTGPALARATNSATNLVNMGLTSPNYRFASANTGITTALPSNLSAQTATAFAWFAGIS